jgi:hypothetical protein
MAGLAYLADGSVLLVQAADSRWTLPGWATYRVRNLRNVQAAVQQQIGDPPGRMGRTVSARTFGQHLVYVVELPQPSRLWRPKLASSIVSALWVRPGDLKTADVDPVVARMLSAPGFWQKPGSQPISPGLMPGFEVNFQRAKQNQQNTPYTIPGV